MLACLVAAVATIASTGTARAALAQGSDATSDDDGAEVQVTVATKALEPFVFADSEAADGSGLRGYSIDVWNEIAERLGLQTTWVVQESVGDILESTRNGDVDLAMAGISMTAERETFVDFSHPYYDSGLQVAVKPGADKATWRTIVELLTSRAVLTLVGGLLLLTTMVAHVVWWTERRHNHEFPQSYRKGIGEALWWSSVSVVTGGEAVKNINRPLSRLFAVGWMVVGLFLFTFVTAQAASVITINGLQSDIAGIEDLPGRSVVTVEDTVADAYLREFNVPFQPISNLEEALEGVADGTYDAVVYDSPILAYRASTDYSGRIELAGEVFAPDPYGIALISGSDLREAVNAELLSMSRDGTLDALNQKWLGVDR